MTYGFILPQDLVPAINPSDRKRYHISLTVSSLTTEHHIITQTIAFLERHGYALLFAWVLAEQSAVPLPSIPLLLAAGALIRTGRLNPVPAVACCVLAALIADTVWFQLGRQRGRRVLGFLCRVSLEPDSCVRLTENAFLKYGMKCLLVSKFVPGLNAVAAPLAGNSRTSFRHFLFYDAAGASIWSGTYLALGFIFGEQLETVLAYASGMGSRLVLLVTLLLALWIAWKFTQRRLFLRRLATARITPEELRDRLNAGDDLFVVDLRTRLSEDDDIQIPGAQRISPENLAARSREIPRDRDVVLLCS